MRSSVKNRVLLILIIISSGCAAQPSENDYKFLNEVMLMLFGLETTETIHLSDKLLAFPGQKSFFSKDMFEAFVEGIPGNEEARERRRQLATETDYDYMVSFPDREGTWNIDKFEYPYAKIPEDTARVPSILKVYFGAPFYDKERTTAFVYIMGPCISHGCSSTSIVIFKLIEGKWARWLSLPISY